MQKYFRHGFCIMIVMTLFVRSLNFFVLLCAVIGAAPAPSFAVSDAKAPLAAPAKTGMKFFATPKRGRQGLASLSQVRKKYPVASVPVNKLRAAKAQKSAADIPPPMDGDAHKLLLYVYDDMH